MADKNKELIKELRAEIKQLKKTIAKFEIEVEDIGYERDQLQNQVYDLEERAS